MKRFRKNIKNPIVSCLALFILFTGLFCSKPKAQEDKKISKPSLQDKNARMVKPWGKIKLDLVASGFQLPTYLTHAGDGSGRIFVVEKPGQIKIIKEGEVLSNPFLDIASQVRSRESERGLLSVAFHPNYRENGRFFVNYSNLEGNTVIAEYMIGDHPDQANTKSERIFLTIKQPASNHNGGGLEFGPDGYLYIGMGDGGAAADPWGNAQNTETFLGKMLRIDVDGDDPYGIPEVNPFIGMEGYRPEIWAYGLRNPWRYSFDAETGDLYIADVGQYKWEEIHVQPAKSPGGENYGWDILEGFNAFELPEGYDLDQLTMPVLEYDHDLGCSITGGYVYRGKKYPSSTGTYFFSDFCAGTIWGLKKNSKGEWEWAEFLDTQLAVSSFGVDEEGEIYVLDYNEGTVYQLRGVEE
ncbi:PQQ-dependent sugar dehydrogenase [candidate division TA06 bacterium]|nr:PQQ-dependent sugar dehydrogenase [candidate division TA06 bacterium]